MYCMYLVTDKPRGSMIGHWNLPIIELIDIPNSVIAIGVNKQTNEYDWVIEYQCVQVGKYVPLAGK